MNSHQAVLPKLARINAFAHLCRSTSTVSVSCKTAKRNDIIAVIKIEITFEIYKLALKKLKFESNY